MRYIYWTIWILTYTCFVTFMNISYSNLLVSDYTDTYIAIAKDLSDKAEKNQAERLGDEAVLIDRIEEGESRINTIEQQISAIYTNAIAIIEQQRSLNECKESKTTS
jgi:hypothetical protein